MRIAAIIVLAALTASCIDLQSSYTAEARDQCRDIINADERRECLRSVEDNDYDQRAERRRGADTDALPLD